MRLELRQREKVREVELSPSVQCQREEAFSVDNPNTTRIGESELDPMFLELQE